MKNRIEIVCDRGRFEADILLEQKPYFNDCCSCTGDGRQTFIVIKEIVDINLMEEVSARSRIGAVIKKALLDKFDGRYFCTDCATRKWEITIQESKRSKLCRK